MDVRIFIITMAGIAVLIAIIASIRGKAFDNILLREPICLMILSVVLTIIFGIFGESTYEVTYIGEVQSIRHNEKIIYEKSEYVDTIYLTEGEEIVIVYLDIYDQIDTLYYTIDGNGLIIKGEMCLYEVDMLKIFYSLYNEITVYMIQ